MSGVTPWSRADERRSAAPEAALNLVEDQQGAGLVGGLARREQEIAPERVGAGQTLHRFEDERGGGRVDRLRQHPEVATGHELDVERLGRKAVPALRAPGDRGGGGGAAVEGAFDGDDLGPAGFAKGEAQRVLVRLGTAVDEEGLLEAFGGEADQRLSGPSADEIRHRVRLELELAGLVSQRREQPRVTVAEERHGVSAVEVENPPAVPGLEPDAFATHRLDGEVLVDRQQIARFELRRRRLRTRLCALQGTGDHLFSSHFRTIPGSRQRGRLLRRSRRSDSATARRRRPRP